MLVLQAFDHSLYISLHVICDLGQVALNVSSVSRLDILMAYSHELKLCDFGVNSLQSQYTCSPSMSHEKV